MTETKYGVVSDIPVPEPRDGTGLNQLKLKAMKATNSYDTEWVNKRKDEFQNACLTLSSTVTSFMNENNLGGMDEKIEILNSLNILFKADLKLRELFKQPLSEQKKDIEFGNNLRFNILNDKLKLIRQITENII